MAAARVVGMVVLEGDEGVRWGTPSAFGDGAWSAEMM